MVVHVVVCGCVRLTCLCVWLYVCGYVVCVECVMFVWLSVWLCGIM